MRGALGQYCGIPVFVDEHCTVNKQFRFPRCKSHRIHKKFKKNPSNYKTYPSMFQTHQCIICHPSIYTKFKEDLPFDE